MLSVRHRLRPSRHPFPSLRHFVSNVTHQLTHWKAVLLAFVGGYMAPVHISSAVNTATFWFLFCRRSQPALSCLCLSRPNDGKKRPSELSSMIFKTFHLIQEASPVPQSSRMTSDVSSGPQITRIPLARPPDRLDE